MGNPRIKNATNSPPGPLSNLETDSKSLIGVTSPPCARESQSPLIDSLSHMEREGELEKEGMQGRQKNTTEDGYHRLTYLGVDRIHKTNEAVIPPGDSFLWDRWK